ncbi:DNA-binding protein [Mycolicibacterium smegmatis]|uniref:DNA-binding protein n=1 Tax=Mycolicibacterium smegmatis TaxID=1772 RepID=UPI001EFB4531|nr:DNA-binding protein [Mycolicibacterium smegmatis]ULN72271.1 DNA-binding protein [Mycolicibacterium smegmatis]
MTARTFSVEEYAIAVRGSAKPADVKWLERHLRGEAEPRLPGFKAGRKWRATEDDIAQAIELLRPAKAATPTIPATSSMTRTSRRRLAS